MIQKDYNRIADQSKWNSIFESLQIDSTNYKTLSFSFVTKTYSYFHLKSFFPFPYSPHLELAETCLIFFQSSFRHIYGVDMANLNFLFLIASIFMVYKNLTDNRTMSLSRILLFPSISGFKLFRPYQQNVSGC